MKKHTSNFKEEIKTLGKQQSVRITYKENNVTKTLTNEDINSATPNYEASLLKSVMKALELDSNISIPKNTEIKFEYGLLVNGTYEYLDYGNYIVAKEPEKQEDTLSYKITCYDKMLYSMKDYEHIEITYPCTIKEYLIALCNKIGLEFKDSTFANQDREIQNELFMTTNEDGTYSSMGYTYRDVLDQIAETTGGCICLTLDDKVEVRYVNKTINYEQSEKSNIIQFKTEVEEPIILERLEGKSIQATRSGKNKLPYNYYDGNSKTVNGITFTVNKDRSITANGKATANAAFSITNPNNYAIVAGSYKLVGENNTYTKTAIRGSYKKADGTITYISSVSSFTIPEGATEIYIYIVILQGETVNNVTFYPMLLNSTETDLTFEAGGASPSPDYPSEIENVEGKNLFDGNKSEWGKYNVWQHNTGNYANAFVNVINIKGLNKCSISFKNNTRTFRFGYQFIDDNENYLSGVYWSASTNEKVFANISVPENASKIIISQLDGQKEDDIEIQLEEGTVATPYVPYDSLEFKVEGKNIFDINKRLQGTINSDGDLEISRNVNKFYEYDFKENTQYTFSAYVKNENENKGNVRFKIVYKDGTEDDTVLLNRTTTYEHITYTSALNKTIDYISINYGSIGTMYIKNGELQIEEGTQATPYEPYKSQVATFPLGEEKLMEGSYLADDGVHHTRKQVVFDGTEDWRNFTNGTYHRYYMFFPNSVKNVGLSSHFILGIHADRNNADNDLKFFVGDSYINFRRDSITSLNDWKAFLAEQYANGTPVIVEYELATEEVVPYTEEQKTILTSIKTMKGTNIFEFPSDTIISYPINYDTIDEEYINDTNVNFGEKYGAINSIVLARAGESDKIYKKDQASIDKNGLCELMISENQFMNFNDRSDYLQELSDKLFGIEYYLNDFTSTGIMYYDLLDVYNVKIGDKTYNCLMLNDEQDITQGLEENIYTERPEKSETDYTKADKTDQKINQTNLVVDKQNQKIEGVISQIGDRSEKTTTITADIDGLNSKVSQIEDITDETSSTTGTLILENCQKGPLLNLKIFGNNNVFKYLYPSDTLYPSNTLYPYGDSRIVVTSFPNGSEIGTSKTYELGVMDVLRQSGNIRDEFILDQSRAKIIRRINKDGSIKDNEEIEELGEIHIDLEKGKNVIQIQNYTAEMYCKYAIQSEYTDVFATKVEMNSEIKQTASEINLEVSKKVNETELGTKIVQNFENVKIAWNKITEFIQMMILNGNASLAILDNSKKILM